MGMREEYWCLTRDMETGKVVRMEKIAEPVHIETFDTRLDPEFRA